MILLPGEWRFVSMVWFVRSAFSVPLALFLFVWLALIRSRLRHGRRKLRKIRRPAPSRAPCWMKMASRSKARAISYSSQVDRYQRRDAHGQGWHVRYAKLLPPGHLYRAASRARDMQPGRHQRHRDAGAAATANFNLDWINPGPVRAARATFAGDVADNLPINGRNYLTAGETLSRRASGGRRALDPGQERFPDTFHRQHRGTHHPLRRRRNRIDGRDQRRGDDEPAGRGRARSDRFSRVHPSVFQSLNATGSVRVSTRSARR